MDDAAAVRTLQRAGELREHGRGPSGWQRAIGERFGQAVVADEAHHEIRGMWLAPIVVERDDVGVFEPGNDLGLGLEPADELRVVGELGRYHFDRDLASHTRLIGAIDRAERATAEHLAQLVATHRQPSPRPVGGRGSGSVEL